MLVHGKARHGDGRSGLDCLGIAGRSQITPPERHPDNPAGWGARTGHDAVSTAVTLLPAGIHGISVS